MIQYESDTKEKRNKQVKGDSGTGQNKKREKKYEEEKKKKKGEGKYM